MEIFFRCLWENKTDICGNSAWDDGKLHCAREVDTKRLFRYTLFLKVDTHDIFTSSCFTKVDIFQLFSGISFSKVDTPL